MKAISLFSGGLDSQLAVCLIKEQGIEIEAINFKSPFFGAEERTVKAAQDLKIKLHIINLDNDYIEKVIKNPVYGYGKNMNPCIDCHAYMFKQAGDIMQELGASFIISGEVAGQRPMSQNKSALNAVDKLSGYKGYILRPLSAMLLSPTIPEIEGWIDRERLESISGRSRNRQMELALKYNITDYPSPAGGCLLIESNFANRLKKMFAITPDVSTKEMEILKYGRHLYLANNLLSVGRNQAENENIQRLAKDSDLLMKVTERPGPTALLRLNEPATTEQINTAAAIVARYSDAKNDPIAKVKIYNNVDEIIELVEVRPMSVDEVPASI